MRDKILLCVILTLNLVTAINLDQQTLVMPDVSNEFKDFIQE
jgi:hypothetical protein